MSHTINTDELRTTGSEYALLRSKQEAIIFWTYPWTKIHTIASNNTGQNRGKMLDWPQAQWLFNIRQWTELQVEQLFRSATSHDSYQ